MRRGLAATVLALGLMSAPALADDAGDMAAQLGITPEMATCDLRAQADHGLPGRVEEKLGAAYGGVWFNNQTCAWMVNLPPGASKTAAKEAVGTAVARYPLVKRTWAELRGIEASLNARLASRRAVQKVLVGATPHGSTVQVLYSSDLPAPAKAEVRSAASGEGAKAAVTAPAALAQSATSCTFPYCGGIGGAKIEGPPQQFPIRKEGVPTGEYIWGNFYCSSGFIVRGSSAIDWKGQLYVLFAGHCIQHANEHPADSEGPWVARSSVQCDSPPGANCHPKAPYPASPGECRMWPELHYMDHTGDMGLLRLDNCNAGPFVTGWPSSEPFQLADRTLCAQGGIKGGVGISAACHFIPASIKAFPGLWICHYGANYNEGRCGEAKLIDITTTIEYRKIGAEYGPIPVEHTDLICAPSAGGDSGSPEVTTGERKATGILIAGGGNPACTAGTGSSIEDEIGVALNALGVKF